MCFPTNLPKMQSGVSSIKSAMLLYVTLVKVGSISTALALASPISEACYSRFPGGSLIKITYIDNDDWVEPTKRVKVRLAFYQFPC